MLVRHTLAILFKTGYSSFFLMKKDSLSELQIIVKINMANKTMNTYPYHGNAITSQKLDPNSILLTSFNV